MSAPARGSYRADVRTTSSTWEMSQMPKTSKTTASQHERMGTSEAHTEELDGYTVNFVSVGDEDVDLGPLLKGLPDDRCQCPHWGYMIAGRQVVTYADREEVLLTGDAFYMSPGHSPLAESGSEFVIISPTDELRATEDVIARNAQALHGA